MELKSGKREVKRLCMRKLLTSHQTSLIIGSQTQRPESMIDALMMNECNGDEVFPAFKIGGNHSFVYTVYTLFKSSAIIIHCCKLEDQEAIM